MDFTTCMPQKNVREEFRNDPIKTCIPEKGESVRRMLHAKPSMTAVVVQLLVDWL
jgi:hypothetical protein